MVNYFTNNSVSVVAASAVLFIILHVTHAREPISYEDFLQSYEDAVKRAMGNTVQVSKLPPEVLFFIVDLYEDIVYDFPKITKARLTKILAKDMESRTNYYEKNKKIFEAFVLTVLEKDMSNYPAEDSKINVAETAFLSTMIMDTVTMAMIDTIDSKRAPLDESWKILNLKDAFRTVYFYCKYPKEMSPFLTEKMRVEVKEWLDSTATWGKWGFNDGVRGDSSVNNEPVMKFEL